MANEYALHAGNILCNSTLWSLFSGEWTWNISDPHCKLTQQFTPSNEVSVAGIAPNYPESLSWRNYNLTTTLQIMSQNGLYFAGVIFRVQVEPITFYFTGIAYNQQVVFSEVVMQYDEDKNAFSLKSQFARKLQPIRYKTSSFDLSIPHSISVIADMQTFTIYIDEIFQFVEIYRNTPSLNAFGSVGVAASNTKCTYSSLSVQLNNDSIDYLDRPVNIGRDEIAALIDLYQSTNGQYWHSKWNYSYLQHANAKNGSDIGLDVCNIYGVICTYNISTPVISITIQYIKLSQNNLTGSIPSSISSFTNLYALDLSGNRLYGTMPCLPMRQKLLNILNNNLNGTLANCVFNSHYLAHVNIANNSFRGGMPQSLCNSRDNLLVLIVSNNSLDSTIPKCVWNMPNLYQLQLNVNAFEGVVQAWPPNALYFRISNNRFSGTLPPLNYSASRIQHIFLDNNQFTGSISSIFPDVSLLSNIRTFALQENMFYDDDITELLQYLFINATELELIALFNNDKISGAFPGSYNDVAFNQSSLKYLAIHNSDFSGSLPTGITFQALELFTVYGNRLSCSIPPNLMQFDDDLTPLILSSNFFTCKDSSSFPEWMRQSPFVSATALYATLANDILSTIITVVAFVAILVFAIQSFIVFYRKRTATNMLTDVHLSESLLSDNDRITVDRTTKPYQYYFDDITDFFQDYWLIVVCILLLICYHLNAIYFLCIPLLNSFTFSYYSYEDSEYPWIDIMVTILWILVNVLFWRNMLMSHTINVRNHSLNIELQSETTHAINPNNRCFLFAQWMSLLSAYVLASAMTLLYIITRSLPADNRFNIDETEVKFIHYSIPWILTVNNAFIVPHLTDTTYQFVYGSYSSRYISHYRAQIVLLIRTFSISILPFILSIFLLNDCMGLWTVFWERCLPENRHQFNVEINSQFGNPVLQTDSDIFYINHLSLLSEKDVCSLTENVKWDKCLRSFSSQWSLVIVSKLLTTCCLPFLVFLYKRYVERKLYVVLSKCCCVNKISHHFEGKSIAQINIDMEYVMILTKLETMIIYSMIVPFSIPLTLLSIKINLFVYHLMIEKEKFVIKPFNADIVFPIHLLSIAIVLEQCLICCFAKMAFGSNSCFYALVISLICIDSVFIYKYFKQNQSRNKYIEMTKTQPSLL
eukprot:82561_1